MEYLRFALKFNLAFPGFETDVHGLVETRHERKTAFFVNGVKVSTAP